MMRNLCELLAAREKPLALREVLEHLRSRDAIVATFLALLELIRLQAVAIRQSELFGEIELRKHKGFGTAIAGFSKEPQEDYR
jgi:segregation and condensation protein A